MVRYQGGATVEVDDEPDPVAPDAVQHDIADLPDETLAFLLPSRYCEVDGELMQVAWDRFGGLAPGWGRVQAVCDFVHEWLTFDYQQARPTRTALDAYRERVGVCRDFTHLFVTLCRCLNIPARYVAGYLGDIGVPPDPAPMDFSAWARVFLGGQWHTFDPRHNERRIGRVLMAQGRDATDIAVVTVFGPQWLHRFDVVTEEQSPS
ncbi:MAG: transglutaminase family protein [Tetrasphaera sp.]